MKKVIYTCLVGKYDELMQPKVVDTSYDYICFSNDFVEQNIGVWKIRKIPFDHPDKTRLSRYVKFFPNKVLAEYEYSVWLDANLRIQTENFYKSIERQISCGNLIAQVPHVLPPIDCIYDEIKYAFKLTRISFRDARKQYKHLKQDGFPSHYGLFENNIIARFHNDLLVKKISEDWWREYMAFSKRDQFSLMYVYWKNSYTPSLIFGSKENSRNSTCIEYVPHKRILSKITPLTIVKSLKKNTIKGFKLVLNSILVYFIG
jgi:hypothetical protein